jgi:hypothetical protein
MEGSVVVAMEKAENHCPECGVFVKPENLPSHLRKAHGKSEEAARLERRTPSAQRRRGSRPFPLWVVLLVVVVAVVASGAFVAYRLSPPPAEDTTPLTEMCVQHTPDLSIHWHADLAIAILGTPSTIPADIGIVRDDCYRPLHTHLPDGRIHIELPGPRAVYLKDFFAIWGKPFSRDQVLTYVADATHEIVMFVGGVRSNAYENLALLDLQNISIEYRTL